MPLSLIVVVLAGIGLSFVTAVLLRHRAGSPAEDHHAQDRLISSGATPPGVIQNASVASTLHVALVVAVFAWGAIGDFKPVLLASAMFALGLVLLYGLRRPILAFMDAELARDRSVTVHEFIARHHGNDGRVRLLAAMLTVAALFGLMVADAVALAALLEPLLPAPAHAAIWTLVGLTLFFAVSSGNSAAMYAAQAQLGLIFFGLFGALVLLLYIPVSALKPMQPSAMLAVTLVGVAAVTMLLYRRSRYVDTTPLQAGPGPRAIWAKGLRTFQKILNPLVTTLIVLVVLLVIMAAITVGADKMLRDSVNALQSDSQLAMPALLALAAAALLYPLVDITNWQRIAAFAKDTQHADPAWRYGALRAIMRRYALEVPLFAVLACAMGAIAVASLDTAKGDAALPAFMARLSAQDDWIGAAVQAMLLLAFLAILLSAMSAMLSAAVCTFHYDIRPAWGEAAKPATVQRSSSMAGAVFGAAIVAASVAAVCLEAGPSSRVIFALLVASCCAQLALAPPILASVAGHQPVAPLWISAALVCGAASGLGAVLVHLASGADWWLWAAVPASLAAGALCCLIGRLLGARGGGH